MTQVAGTNAAATAGKAAGSARITSLDSLRGLAALVVVFHHLDNVLDESGQNRVLGPIFHGSPLRFLVGGRTAVMLFFILSGFALSISIGKNFNYWTYLLRRICRLMIPCVVAILVAAAAYYFVHPQPIPVLGDWFNLTVWDAPLTWGLVARHIAMTGTPADTSLVNVLWSLVVELRISLIFPLLYFAARKHTKTAAVVLLAMYFLFRYFVMQSGNYVPFYNKNWVEALENIGYYTPFFLAGIVMRENIDGIRRFVARLHWIVMVLALLISIRLEESGVDFQIGVGAFLTILVCVASPLVSRGLAVRPIEWLGRVSYSLYLTHLTLLATVFHLFYGKVNRYVLAGGILVGSLLLAEVFYRLVEAPSIALSRRFTAKKPVASPIAV